MYTYLNLNCIIINLNVLNKPKSHHSGYGDHYGAYSGGGDCCPLVVDPLTYAALLGFLAAAVYFFQVLIEMSMLMMRRKRRRKRELGFQTFLAVDTLDNWLEGKSTLKSQRF